MREGRETEAGEAGPQRQANVVRLPRDWLGPRDELVPFGPRAVCLDAEVAPASAQDFWGERAAAIHDALQAPANPVHPDSESAGPAVAPGASEAPRVDAVPSRPRKPIRGIPLASAEWWMVPAVAAGLAIAVVVVVALASSISRPRAHAQSLGRSQAGFAAVLGSGVSNALRVARIELSNLRGDTAVVHRAPASSGRRTAHVVRTPKPARKAASPAHGSAVSSGSSAAAPSSSTRTEPSTSSTYTTTAQTYDASNEPVSTHSDAPRAHNSAPTGSGSSSPNSSKTTLRSLITGAGMCSCQWPAHGQIHRKVGET